MKIIAQGAEALIIKKDNQIIKNRIKKGYRLRFLDEKLRKQRTRKEAKLLEKASKIIPVPKILKQERFHLHMQFLKGKKLSLCFDALKNKIRVAEQMGKSIAKLHNAGIIHGDLTTSNMLYVKNSKNKIIYKYNKKSLIEDNNLAYSVNNFLKDINKSKIFFIDFGLGFESSRIEDKATDLHVLKEALQARHFKYAQKLWVAVLKGYKLSENAIPVIKQLERVEQRGRYRVQY